MPIASTVVPWPAIGPSLAAPGGEGQVGSAASPLWARIERMGWHHHSPDAVVGVSCEGEEHRVRWVRGQLLLDDHDLAAEEVLLALGGEAPRCVQLVALWREAVADGGFLEEWAAGRPDRVRRAWLRTALRRLRAEGVQDLLPSISPRRAERMGRVLTELPPALQDRAAVAATARALRTEPGPGSLHRHVARAVEVRARRAFVESLAAWRRQVPIAALVPFRCEVGLGVVPEVAGVLAGRSSWCTVRLDAAWLRDVWGAGLAVAGGHLVLAVDHGTGGARRSLDVHALRWAPGVGAGPGDRLVPRVAPARLARAATTGTWRLTWGDGAGAAERCTSAPRATWATT
jgi:hypothetical protein